MRGEAKRIEQAANATHFRGHANNVLAFPILYQIQVLQSAAKRARDDSATSGEQRAATPDDIVGFDRRHR